MTARGTAASRVLLLGSFWGREEEKVEKEEEGEEELGKG